MPPQHRDWWRTLAAAFHHGEVPPHRALPQALRTAMLEEACDLAWFNALVRGFGYEARPMAATGGPRFRGEVRIGAQRYVFRRLKTTTVCR